MRISITLPLLFKGRAGEGLSSSATDLKKNPRYKVPGIFHYLLITTLTELTLPPTGGFIFDTFTVASFIPSSSA